VLMTLLLTPANCGQWQTSSFSLLHTRTGTLVAVFRFSFFVFRFSFFVFRFSFFK
jgi:hypothetical protein